jgi:hypothetical protein
MTFVYITISTVRSYVDNIVRAYVYIYNHKNPRLAGEVKDQWPLGKHDLHSSMGQMIGYGITYMAQAQLRRKPPKRL